MNNHWDASTKKDLHRWITKSLEPICDADPPVLADYVLALLQHDGNETQVRKRLVTQLDEFLANQTSSFVDTLLSALRTKAYIPYTSSSTPQVPSPSHTAAIPIPLDAVVSSSLQSRGLKRGFDDRGDQPRDVIPSKVHRGHSSSFASQSTGRNLLGATRENQITSTTKRTEIAEGMDVDEGSPSTPAKPICRDYHHKGYCARGALCNYSHGEDAVVPTPGMWLPDGSNFNPMMSFMPMMMPFANMQFPYMDGGAYDPNQSQMDLGALRSGISSGLNGHKSSEVGARESDLLPSEYPESNIPSSNGQAVGQRAVRERSRGRSGYSSHAPPSNEKTLVVEKIPSESLSLESVNEWFRRFGTVTNVAVDKRGSKALVSFQNHDEALAAWKSQDAVFGNRFVKVFWHRPMEGQGTAGKRALEASAPRLQSAEQSLPRPKTNSVSDSVEQAKSSLNGKTALGLEARNALEKNMAEQKVLFSRLKSSEGDQKKAILARIRVLSEGMEDPLSVPPSALEFDERQASVSPTKLERLDKELDLQQAVQDLTRRAHDPNEDHAAIRVELEKLKTKAIAEGINLNDDQSEMSPNRQFPSYYPRRPYRGRGRVRAWGRGSYRGRGLSLDNRPKRLIVRGVPIEDDQQLDQIREWHQATGQADTMTFEDNGDINVQFRTRAAAEQALAGSSYLKAHIQGVNFLWPTPPPVNTNDIDRVTGKSVPLSDQERSSNELADSNIDELAWGQ